MTFAERTNAIGELLREHILPRYKRPDHLDDATARAEVADMVSDLNAVWPLMDANRFGNVAEGVARNVRITHASRTWPTISALVKALQASIAPPAKPTAGDDAQRDEAIFAMVLEWWEKHRDPMPSVAKQHHTARMVSESIATAGELRRAGFPIPDALMAEARAEPDPRQAGIIGELQALGEVIRSNHSTRGDIRP